jgi:putative membrane protein
MIQDHTTAGDKLKSTVQGMQGMTIPTSLDQPHQQMVQTLQGASGEGFDRDYIQMQVTAHRDAVNLFDQYAQSGDNQQLKQFAQQTVPTLREHLQMVEQIQTSLPPAQVGATQPGAAGSARSTAGANQGAGMGALTFLTQREPGMYSASDLIGTDVRGGNNEDIGEVGDVLIDRNGQVRAVVIDVGGFLGIGETPVAIPMQQVQFRSAQQNANATGTVAGNTNVTGATATTGQNTAARAGSTQAGTNADEPDVIIVMMTKDQLQNAPRFQNNTRRGGAGGTTGTGTPRQ